MGHSILYNVFIQHHKAVQLLTALPRLAKHPCVPQTYRTDCLDMCFRKAASKSRPLKCSVTDCTPQQVLLTIHSYVL